MDGGGKAEDPSQGSTKSTEAGEITNVTKSLVNVLTCKNHPI
jgi:hypothetical protein